MEQLLSKDTGTITSVCHSAMLSTLCYRPAEVKGDMATGANPAYGMSGPHGKPAETEGEYEISPYTQPHHLGLRGFMRVSIDITHTYSYLVYTIKMFVLSPCSDIHSVWAFL